MSTKRLCIPVFSALFSPFTTLLHGGGFLGGAVLEQHLTQLLAVTSD